MMGQVRFSAGETDIEYCMGELEDAELCIIIDAAYRGHEPCSVNALDLEEVLAQIKPVYSFHELDLIHAMKRENLIRKGILIAVEVSSVNYSAELSPLMKERFEEICRHVRELIKDYLEKCSTIEQREK
jgi:hydrogenase maturation protease